MVYGVFSLCDAATENEMTGVVEHGDRIKGWVEHIKLISSHAENSEGYNGHKKPKGNMTGGGCVYTR